MPATYRIVKNFSQCLAEYVPKYSNKKTLKCVYHLEYLQLNHKESKLDHHCYSHLILTLLDMLAAKLYFPNLEVTLC